MIYRLSLLSNAFTHVVKAMNDNSKVVEIYAKRSWVPNKVKTTKEKELPYVRYEIMTMHTVRLARAGKIKKAETFVDMKKTVAWLGKQEIPDLPVQQLGFRVMDLIEERQDYLVIMQHMSAMESYIRRDCMELMKEQIDNLGFKCEVLTLIGIYKVEDVHRKKNLLGEINDDKKTMIDIANALFKENIKVENESRKIRCLRGYDMTSKDVLILKEYNKV
jgi:hypothetical protein